MDGNQRMTVLVRIGCYAFKTVEWSYPDVARKNSHRFWWRSQRRVADALKDACAQIIKSASL
jgi:hypothetical protein